MLDVQTKTCRLGKMANNLETHGDEEVPGFTFPVTELLLSREEIREFLEDKYADRFLFNDKRGHLVPSLDCFEPFKLKHDFEGVTITLVLASSVELEFENSKVRDVFVTAQPGGMSLVEFKIYVHPGLSKENLLLQRHQNTEIKLSFADAIVAVKKKSPQQELPLNAAEGDSPPDPDASDFESAAKAQVAAFKRGRKGRGKGNGAPAAA